MRKVSIVILIKVILIGFFGLFFGSCVKQEQETKSYFEESLFATYAISEINRSLVNTDEVEVAPGTWQSAMRMSVRVNDFETIDYCLLVKAPYQVEPGTLKFARASSFEKPCSEYLFAPNETKPIKFYNLLIKYERPKLLIKVDQDEYIYNFRNLRDNGSLFVSLDDREGSAPKEEALDDGTICLQVEDDCSLLKNSCEHCLNSSYYIKNSACQGSYSKICGEDNCGDRGEPACIRGHVASQVKDYCVQDSPVGFCSGEGRVGCVNGLLICE